MMHSLPPKRGSASQSPVPNLSSAPPGGSPFESSPKASPFGSSPKASPFGETTPASWAGVDVPLTEETVEDIPWNSDVVVCREEQAMTGVFGVGLRIDVNANAKVFPVRAVNNLQDPTGRDISSTVPIGDTLCFCNDRSVVKEGEAIIESTILGECNSLLKLTLQSKTSNQMYDRMVKRHVPIRQWEFTRKWYEVKDEFRGKSLATDATIVDSLDAMRRTVIDSDGREMDFLAGIKKRGSSVGIHFQVGAAGPGKPVLRVVQGSPAAIAQIQKGDVVTAVNGETSDEEIQRRLGGDERIGSSCRITVLRQGRKHDVEVSRTQVAAMHRVEELLEFVDTAPLDPTHKGTLKHKISELERERLYEERVMAGRLNTLATDLLFNVTKAANTLGPMPDSSGSIDAARAEAEAARAEAEAAARELRAAKSRIDELMRSEADLKAQLEALKRQMANMVPASELKSSQEECKDLRERLEALRKQSGDMVSRSELDKMEKKMKEMLEQLRGENKELLRKLRAAEDRSSDLQTEVDELKRKLKIAQEEAERLGKENGTLKQQLSEAKAGLGGSAAEMDALKRKLKAAEEELAAAKAKLAAAESKASGLETDKDALTRKLKTTEDENGELRAAVEALRKQLAAAKEEADRLASEKEALSRQVKAMEGEVAELRKANEGLKQKLKAAEDDNMTLKTQVDASKHSSAGLQKDLEEADAKLKAAKKEIADQAKEMDSLRKQLKKAQTDAQNLQADLDAAKAATKKAQDEAADLQAQLDALKRKLKEAEDRAAKLEDEKKALDAKLNRAEAEAADLKKKLDDAAKKLRAAEDENATLKGENASLKTQLQEAVEARDSMAKELKEAKEAQALLAADLKKAQAQGTSAKSDLEEANKALAKAEQDKKKLKAEVEALEKKLKDKDAEVRKLKGELEEARAEVHAAQEKAKRLEEQLEDEKKAHEETKQKLRAATNEVTSLKSEVEKLKKQLADAQANMVREDQNHAATRAQLDDLLKQLAAAGLADEALRQKFLGGISAPLDPTQVLRMMEATKKMSASAPSKSADLLEACAAGDASLLPEEVTRLLKLMGEGALKRSPADTCALLHILNQSEAWPTETLKKERDVLKEQAVGTAKELCARYDAEVTGLKQKIRELLTPDFDTKGCTFTGKLPLTIRGREGATIYANIRDQTEAPTFEAFDRSCMTPMVLLVEDTKVVTVASSLDGVEMSESRAEDFVKQKIVVPEVVPRAAAPPPVELVGVGMLLSRPTESGPHTDMSVKEIFEGYAVDKDGTVKRGDVLVEVDGQGVQLMTMDEVSELIVGPVGSEVTLLFEKEEFKGKREELCADGLYTVKVVRCKPEKRVGVGMLLSRPLPKEGEEEDITRGIKVREIYSGGSVEENGEIKVGDTLLEVDGQNVTTMTMDSVERLIKGKEGTDVSFIFAKTSDASQKPEPDEAGNFPPTEPAKVAVTLTRKKDIEAAIFSFLDSGKDLLSSTFEEGWNSVKSLRGSNPPSQPNSSTPKQPPSDAAKAPAATQI